jgi:hypothetical protein
MNSKKVEIMTAGIDLAVNKEDLSQVNRAIEFLFSKELAHSLKIKLKHLKEASAENQERKRIKLQKKLPVYCYA